MNTAIQLFKSYLEISLFASAMIFIVLLVRAIAKNKINLKVISFLWILVVFRLCIPGMLESPVHIDGLFPAAEETVEQASASGHSPSYADNQDITVKNTPSFSSSDNAFKPTENVNTINDLTTNEPKSISVWEKAADDLRSFDPWLIALILWITGCVVVLLLAIRERLVFGLHIRKNSEPVKNQAIIDMVNQHRHDNRIQRKIRISSCPSIHMPLVIGVFKPHILLPTHMVKTMEGKFLYTILLHEVCHIKRNDVIKSYACVIAKAIHWFNPIVWIGVKRMKEDMEFSCDQHVFTILGNEQGIHYCESLIQATRFLTNRKAPQLASSLCEKNSHLKKRVVKMINQKRKSKSAAAISLILAFIMCVACFTTACQPTPEEPIVIGKDQGDMLFAAAQTPSTRGTLVEQTKAPVSYTTNVSAAGGKLSVVSDGAAVVLPDTDAMSIMRVSAADFTQEQVDGLISALFEGQKLYEVKYGPETKDEISEQIVRWQQLKNTEEYSSEGDQAQVDAHIAMLKEKYENAPETSEDIIIESDGQLKQQESIDYETGEHISYNMGINATTNPDDPAKAARISVENNSDMTESIVDIRTDEDGNITGMSGRFMRRMAMLMYENRGDASDSNFGQNPPTPVDEDTVIDDPEVLSKLTTTPAEAKALVEDMLARAGIDHMAVVAMYLTDDENLGNYDGIVSDAEHYAYQLYLCRTIGGVPVAYLKASSGGVVDMENEISAAKENGDTDAMEQAYSNLVEWYYETIDVMVDDTGIISFNWWSPLDIGETVVENATLMPFDDIAAKFEQQMQLKWEPQAKDEYTTDIAFAVDHVSLEYQRVAEQNETGTGLLVPVWNFYGTSVTTYNLGDTSDGSDTADARKSGFSEPVSLMTINAVDGSIIDIVQGY